MVKLHSFLVLTQDTGEWSGSVVSHLTPVREPPVTARQEDGWSPQSVWRGSKEKRACSSYKSNPSHSGRRLVTTQNEPSQRLRITATSEHLCLLQSIHNYLLSKISDQNFETIYIEHTSHNSDTLNPHCSLTLKIFCRSTQGCYRYTARMNAVQSPETNNRIAEHLYSG